MNWKVGWQIALWLLLQSFVAGSVATERSDPQIIVNDAMVALRENVIRDAALIDRDINHAMVLVEDAVAPHVDMVLVSRLILGEHWGEATTSQRSAFVDSLGQLILRVFAVHVRDYRSAEVSFLPTVFKGKSNDRATVKSRVSRAGGGAVVNVDYRLRYSDTAWKMYDVAIFGVSLVKTYHLSIASDLDKLGLDGVIEQINARLPLPTPSDAAPPPATLPFG